MTNETWETLNQIVTFIGAVLAAGGTLAAQLFGNKKKKAWVNRSHIGAFIGAFLAVGGGLGAWWFGSQIDSEKDARIENLIKAATQTVEKRTSPRTLSAPQVEALVDALAPARGSTVVLHSVLGDHEALAFAGLLRDALLRAEWKVRGIKQSRITDPVPVRALMIFVRVDPTPEYATVLRGSLEAAGLDVVVFRGTPGISSQESPHDPIREVGDVHLVVGTKAR